MPLLTKKYLKLTIILMLFSCGSNKYSVKIEQGNKVKNKVYHDYKTGYHRVNKKDTLYKIALKHNLNVSYLKKINNINNENKIYVGQLIKIKPNTKNLQPKITTTNLNKNNNLSSIKFIWPIKGNVIKNFDAKTNKGIDIASKKENYVIAAADGVVLHADYVKGYGKLIVISHDKQNKILTVYSNLSNILINIHKKVKANEKIALIGEDNKNTKLHFEIRNNNIALNPLNYLPK